MSAACDTLPSDRRPGNDPRSISLCTFGRSPSCTDLRRKELGSLTPRSFRLNDEPATLTVDAACSKHRRKDVLPLHPELVTMLRQWLKGLEPGEFLFPHLGNRRTWLMVKKDLERVGISYETEEGIADFHAAGRHTHITELLRNGVSLVQAKELARHSDVKMTMRYTHVGIEDQAGAVARLPWNRPSDPPPAAQCSSGLEKSTQHIGSERRGPISPFMTSGDSRQDREDAIPETPNPCSRKGYDASCLYLASSGIEAASVEAAGIEPAPGFFKPLSDKDLQNHPSSHTAYWQDPRDSTCRRLPSSDKYDATLAYLAFVWPHLPPHVREAIITLVDAAHTAMRDGDMP